METLDLGGVEVRVRSRVELNPKNTALLVIDMQNDFANPRGRLYVEQARETIPRIKRLLERARGRGVLRIFTLDTHYPGDPEFTLWGEHAVKGSWGWMIVDELKPIEGEILIEKPRYDAFYSTMLDDILRFRGVRNLVVTGTLANVCVLHTIASASMRMYRVYVPIDCISALNDFDYKLTLRQIDFAYHGVLVKEHGGVKFL